MRLFVSRREGIYLLNPSQPTASAQPKKIIEGEFLYGIDYDYSQNKVFWGERDKNEIWTGQFDLGKAEVTNRQKLPLTGIVNPRNFAVDWLAKKIYIVESGSKRIDVSDYSGAQRTVLIADGLTLPIDIAVDPTKG